MIKFFIFFMLLIILVSLFATIFYKTNKSKKEKLSLSTKPIPTTITPPVANSAPVTLKFDISLESSIVIPDALKLPNISGKIRFHQYKVRGKNPVTNRMKTNTVIVKSGTSNAEISSLSGLLEPISITIDFSCHLDMEPSERQIDYAKSLNITIPNDCTFEDLSCLISKQTGDDSEILASEPLRLYASEFGVFTSPYCGIQYILSKLCTSFSIEKLTSFWCYLVYCSLTSSEIGNPHQSPHNHIFDSFYEECSKYSDVALLLLPFDYIVIEKFIFLKQIDQRYKAAKIYELAKNHLRSNRLI